MKPKNCLIFGGSGQIGRHLIRKLTKNNTRVTVVTRNIHQKSYIIKTQANAGYIDIVEANIFVRLGCVPHQGQAILLEEVHLLCAGSAGGTTFLFMHEVDFI